MRPLHLPVATLAVLIACFLSAPPRAAAQSAGLADMPPPPSEWTPSGGAGTSPNSSPTSAGESSSQPDAGESSSKLDPGESSSKSSDEGDAPEPDESGISADGKPSLRHRGSAAVEVQPVIPDQPSFDPLHAQRDLDVGTFYYRKGDYDAAIDRYEEATRLNPKMAKPYLLLGEVYEKRNNVSGAITSYRKYLEMYTDAPDRDKVQKKIDKLQEKSGGRGEGAAGRSG